MLQSEVLKKARELVADPVNWTRGANGRDTDGMAVKVHSSAAVKFCMIGSLRRVLHPRDTTASVKILREVIGKDYVTYWNDYIATHKMMLEVFDQGIQLAIKREE